MMTRFVLIPLILLAIASSGACSRDRSDADQHGPAAAQHTVAAAPGGPTALLPAAEDGPGWAPSRAPHSYTAEDLWQAINGAADSFVAYGVQDVVIANYRHAGTGSEAVVEIYQMKDPLNAYGKYAEERNPDYRFIDVGNEGYSGGTAVNFWKGPYYVKLTSFQTGEAAEQAMVGLARSVAAKVAVAGSDPPELAWLPRANQIPHTARYLPRDVLGQSYFTSGFEARYKAGTNESRIVLIVLDGAATAQDAIAKYRQSVSKDETNTRDLAAPGEGGFAAADRFYGKVTAVRQGKHIVVALGTADEALARAQLAEVVANIR